MRWRFTTRWGWLLLPWALTGCPHTLGREGFTHRAIRADVRARLIAECPEFVRTKHCSGDREYTDACIEHCADALQPEDGGE